MSLRTLAAIVSVCPAVAFGQASFQPLPSATDPHFGSAALGVSPDGVAIVGWAKLDEDGPALPARWVDTFSPPELLTTRDKSPLNHGWATAVSSTGVIVGYARTTQPMVGFSWQASDVDWIDVVPEIWLQGVSADARVIVGYSAPLALSALLLVDGVQAPVPLPKGMDQALLRACSASGGVVAGAAKPNGRHLSPVRWAGIPAITEASVLDGGYGQAMGVSPDGSVVVGGLELTTGFTRPVLWRRSQAGTPLGYIASGGIAVASSRRSVRVVGYSWQDFGLARDALL